MSAVLVRDDPSWWYVGFGNDAAVRRLRVWRVEAGRLVAVITEQPDSQGTTITNAAETVAAQLAAEYPDDVIEIVEHWTATRLAGEHFDGVAIAAAGPTWWPIPTAQLAARLPQLLDPQPRTDLEGR